MERRKAGTSDTGDCLLVHLQALFATACKLTGETAAAADLVQETYLKAYRALAHLEAPQQGKAWLFRILLNTWADQRARAGRLPLPLAHEQLAARQERLACRQAWVLPLSPEEALLKKEMLGELNAALQALPDPLRAVVLLVDLQGFTYDESAKILDVPRGTVMSRLYRARRLLERQLRGEADKPENEGHGPAGV
ncbi:MAG: hypothetical protein KatS3mg131_0446 [Candidatus Tectimicrobiota bacterium]|nr:MAG: hypothetical protein KatS3mg131_0446 [Candidatus Tectomicrobia bacterium]